MDWTVCHHERCRQRVYSLKHLDSTKVIKRIHGAHLKLYFTPPNSPDDFTNGSTANTTLEGDGNAVVENLGGQEPPPTFD